MPLLWRNMLVTISRATELHSGRCCHDQQRKWADFVGAARNVDNQNHRKGRDNRYWCTPIGTVKWWWWTDLVIARSDSCEQHYRKCGLLCAHFKCVRAMNWHFIYTTIYCYISCCMDCVLWPNTYWTSSGLIWYNSTLLEKSQIIHLCS